MTPLKLSIFTAMVTASLVACTAESPEEEPFREQPVEETEQGMGQPGETGIMEEEQQGGEVPQGEEIEQTEPVAPDQSY